MIAELATPSARAADGVPPRLRAIAIAALAIGAAHTAYKLASGEAHDLLWFCNLACPLLALGCALRSARWVGVAWLWLCFGTPLWLLAVSGGMPAGVTSVFTHLGGLWLGFLALRRLGFARGTWRWATLAAWLLMLLTRWLTPARFNVNLAFSVWPGWEALFPSYPLYLALLLASAALCFFAIERAQLALLRRAPSTPRTP